MLIIGHRGAKGLALENTKPSIEAALKHGVDAIEFDVRVSRDNIPVLHHNSDIGISGADLDIAKTDYKDLLAARPELLTLSQAMELIPKQTPIIIEIKLVRAVQPIIDVIQQQLKNGWDAKEISVSSFELNNLIAVRDSLPGVTIIVNEGWSGVRAVNRARMLKTKYITMNQRWLWSGFIRAMIRRGYKLSSYTINNPAQAKRWQKAGLHAVITDYPDRF